MHITVLASEITDTRSIEQLLERHDVGFRIERQSMASSAARRHFQQLAEQHDWKRLPMTFDGERFIGGEPELGALLAGHHSRPETPPATTPASTRTLTWLGVLPFIFAAAGTWLNTPSWAITALQSYAGLILSFMAGSFWGFAPTNAGVRVASVAFPLLAWLLVLTSPNNSTVLLGLATLIGGLLFVDHALCQQGRISADYLRLRYQVTLVVVCSLGTAAMAPG